MAPAVGCHCPPPCPLQLTVPALGEGSAGGCPGRLGGRWAALPARGARVPLAFRWSPPLPAPFRTVARVHPGPHQPRAAHRCGSEPSNSGAPAALGGTLYLGTMAQYLNQDLWHFTTCISLLRKLLVCQNDSWKRHDPHLCGGACWIFVQESFLEDVSIFIGNIVSVSAGEGAEKPSSMVFTSK